MVPFNIKQKIGTDLCSLKNEDGSLFQRVLEKFLNNYPDEQNEELKKQNTL